MSMFVCLLQAPVCFFTLLRYISTVQSLNKTVNIVFLCTYIYLGCRVEFHRHDRTCAWNDAHNINCNITKYGNKYKKQHINKCRLCFVLFCSFLFPSVLPDNAQATGSGYCACAVPQSSPSRLGWNESKRSSSGSTKRNASTFTAGRWFVFGSEQHFNGGNQRCLGDTRTRVTVISSVPQAVGGTVSHLLPQFEGVSVIYLYQEVSVSRFQWPLFFHLLFLRSRSFLFTHHKRHCD